MKRSIIALTLLIAAGLTAARAYYVAAQDATVTIRNNTQDNRWVDVPIEISAAGGNVYSVKNASKMAIASFTLFLYAGHADGHGTHKITVGSDNPLPVGDSVQIDISKQISLLAGAAVQTDMGKIDLWPGFVYFEDSAKAWWSGRYRERQTDGSWRATTNLLPAATKLIGACYDYDMRDSWPCRLCLATECSGCKYPAPQFIRQVGGGYQQKTVCELCVHPSPNGTCQGAESVCQKSDGSACGSGPNVLELDFNKSC